MRTGAAAATVMLLASLGGCSSPPPVSDKLAVARSAVEKAEAHGSFTGIAETDLNAARYYLQQAEDSRRAGRAGTEVDNLAYASEQLATAAMARHDSDWLEDAEARRREAALARHRAETAEMEADRARKLAELSGH